MKKNPYEAHATEILEAFDVENFQQSLLSWYREHKRKLPWRESKDAYRIWVSEIMLQQTRVETVLPYYENFMEKFPSPKVLAEAEEEEVLKAWEGLGYYSRARNLHTAVREVVASYGGKVPDDPDEFAALKGVGPYTKGAVMSIAYDREEPAVDGNVMRVLARLLLIADDVTKQSTRKLMEMCVHTLMKGKPPADFTQALMEVGALVCTPRMPACTACPLNEICRARKNAMVTRLPVKTKKKQPNKKLLAAAVVVSDSGRVLLEQRPPDGLLANMWQFPSVEAPPSAQANELCAYLQKEYGLTVALIEGRQTVKHVFSHLIWHVRVYRAKASESSPGASSRHRWVTQEEAKSLAFPVAHQKIWREQITKQKP